MPITLALTTAAIASIEGAGSACILTLPGEAQASGPNRLPDHLNHERLIPTISCDGRLLALGKWSGHDANTFELDRGGGGCGFHFCRREPITRATDDPRRLDYSGRGIEILDDAEARGISRSRQDLQCRMDAISGHRADDAGACGGRARLCDAGAVVAGERRGRRKSKGLHC